MKNILKSKIAIAVAVLLGILLTFFFILPYISESIEESKQNKWANRYIETLTIEQKVGQLLLVSSRYPDQSEKVLKLFKDKSLAGIITYGKSKDPAHLIYLSQQLHQLSEKYSQVPYWLSMDHEGRGLLDKGTEFPRQIALNSQASQDAYRMAQMVGKELASVGVNLVYAPVLDVNINPNNPVIGSRSFSDQAHKAAKLAEAYLKGMESAGVASVGKHFPGHGRSDGDSHLELPTISSSKKALKKIDLKVFKAAIKAGVPGMMSAHVLYPALDPEVPATLSPLILNNLLRQELKFKGFTISDAMNMKGITTVSSLKDNVLRSIQAGIDVAMLVDNSIAEIEEVYQHVLQSYQNGTLSEERVHQALKRNLIAKKRMALFEKKPPLSIEESNKTLRHPSHLAFADSLRKRSIEIINKSSETTSFNLKNKIVLIISDSRQSFEHYKVQLSDSDTKAILHYPLEKSLSAKARQKLWGKYLNHKKENTQKKLQNFYSGQGLNKTAQMNLFKQILSADIVFADIRNRSQAQDLNDLARNTKVPFVGLYFSSKLDNAFLYQQAPDFQAHLIGHSQTQDLLKKDSQDAFKKLLSQNTANQENL